MPAVAEFASVSAQNLYENGTSKKEESTSRPTTPSSTKLSLYNYQPIKTQISVEQVPTTNNQLSFKGSNDFEIVQEPIESENNSPRSSISSPNGASSNEYNNKTRTSGFYDLSTGQGMIGANLPAFKDTFVQKQQFLIQPQVIRMDTFAITTFNSSDETNSEDESTSSTDNYANMSSLKGFQQRK